MTESPHWAVVLISCCSSLNNYTVHVLFHLNAPEEQHTGRLTFTEKLHIVKVSVLSSSFSTPVFLCVWPHLYSSCYLWAGPAEVHLSSGTRLLRWVFYQPGPGKLLSLRRFTQPVNTLTWRGIINTYVAYLHEYLVQSLCLLWCGLS